MASPKLSRTAIGVGRGVCRSRSRISWRRLAAELFERGGDPVVTESAGGVTAEADAELDEGALGPLAIGAVYGDRERDLALEPRGLSIAFVGGLG